MKHKHPYHIVDLSPWPLFTSCALLFFAITAVASIHDVKFGYITLFLSLLFLLYCMFSWWKDVIYEGMVEKQHNEVVRTGLKIGMLLFIISELAFFGVFFWSVFKSQYNPVAVVEDIWPISEGSWPPKNIKFFDPWNIPFMNTIVLMLSGTTLSWAHHELNAQNQKECVKMLGYTILLGILFSILQIIEYIHAPFSISQGIYPSNFFMSTGFHGIHVIIGTIFLAVCYFRARRGDFFQKNAGHLGFEFAAWYWHFVDVIWICLFIFLYVFAR